MQRSVIPAEWVRKSGISLYGARSDPRDYHSHPEALFWEQCYEKVMGYIENAIQEGVPITLEILANAERLGLEDAIDALRGEDSSERKRDYWFITLFPGMTSSDWRALEPEVLEHLARDEKRLRDEVHSLKAEGQSVRSIANLLGISRNAVNKMLGVPSP